MRTIIITVAIFLIIETLIIKSTSDPTNKILLATMQNHARSLKAMEISLVQQYGITEPEARYHAWVLDDFRLENSKRYHACVPYELYAVMFWHESNLVASAVSKKNAKGRAQTLEDTFAESCRRMKVPSGEVNIWNDWLNMRAGADILSKAYAKGGYEYGIKAYYGGERFKNSASVKKYFREVDSLFKQLSKTYRSNYENLARPR